MKKKISDTEHRHGLRTRRRTASSRTSIAVTKSLHPQKIMPRSASKILLFFLRYLSQRVATQTRAVINKAGIEQLTQALPVISFLFFLHNAAGVGRLFGARIGRRADGRT